MRIVSATEARQQFAELLDATQREAVVIRRRGRNAAVILSPDAYDRLRAHDIETLERFCDHIGRQAAARGLTEEKLARLLDDRRVGTEK